MGMPSLPDIVTLLGRGKLTGFTHLLGTIQFLRGIIHVLLTRAIRLDIRLALYCNENDCAWAVHFVLPSFLPVGPACLPYLDVVSANIIIFPPGARACCRGHPPPQRSFVRVAAYLIDHHHLFSGGEHGSRRRPHRLLPRRGRLRRRQGRLSRRLQLRLWLQHLRLSLLRAHRRERHRVGTGRGAFANVLGRQIHTRGIPVTRIMVI